MKNQKKMSEREAISYVENVLKKWTAWRKHHTKLILALEIILAKIKQEK